MRLLFPDVNSYTFFGKTKHTTRLAPRIPSHPSLNCDGKMRLCWLVAATMALGLGGGEAFAPTLPAHWVHVRRPGVGGALVRNGRPEQQLRMSATEAAGVGKFAAATLVAWGKKKAALAPAVLLPSTPTLVLACTLPTLMGFWKSEYGVSYAYALAMLASGLLVFRVARTSGSMLAMAHSGCLFLYGLRLGLFLLYRETSIARFRDFRETIEKRAQERGSRLSRSPFILGCSFLYLGLAAPLMLTAAPAAQATKLAWMLIGSMYFGLALAAIGDLQKTWVKADRGADALVTSGLFSLLRHPNYTGEMIMWTSSFAVAVVTATAMAMAGPWAASAPWLALSVLGVSGINFVLLQVYTALSIPLIFPPSRPMIACSVGALSLPATCRWAIVATASAPTCCHNA